MDEGFIQVYTGDGKGKTTAALGLAMRACGRGLKVLMIQFLKGRQYGELNSASKVEGFTILQSGRDEFVHKGKASGEDIELAERGLKRARDAMKSRDFDIVILDEVNVAVELGVIEEQEVISLMDEKPPGIELVLTGRGAPEAFISRADLVTEMKKVKHYYDRGISMREGIEW